MTTHKWTSRNIGNQSGKIVLVTGANSGIGFETAKVLAGKNAEVILVVRNNSNGKEAAKKIKKMHPQSKVQVFELDLSSLKSIRNFVKTFSANYNKLDILINNAGVMVPPYGKTDDGFELQFGINHLGHFALTLLLLPLIKDATDARIVNVSSVAHNSGNINFDDLHWEKREYNNWQAYGDSKIANLYFTYELARKLDGSGVSVMAAHPGLTATNLQKNSNIFSIVTPLLGQKPPMGALPTLRAATDPSAKSGDYYGPRGYKQVRGYPVRVNSNKASHDKKIAKRLWEVSEDLTKVTYK